MLGLHEESHIDVGVLRALYMAGQTSDKFKK